MAWELSQPSDMTSFVIKWHILTLQSNQKKKKKKLQFYVSVNPFLHFTMGSAGLFKIFLDQTVCNLVLQGWESKRNSWPVMCLHFGKLLTARGLFCSGWKPERATEPTQGIHKPIVRSEWKVSWRPVEAPPNLEAHLVQGEGDLQPSRRDSWRDTSQRTPSGSPAPTGFSPF